MVGTCSSNGLLKIFKMTVLQLFFIQKVNTKTNIISTEIVIKKQINAYFNEVNLRTFMAAMIMLTAIMSFIIQFLLENHHPKQTPKLIMPLSKSKTLILIFFTLITVLLKIVIFLIKKIAQLEHSHTAESPNIQDNTLTEIATTWNLKTATMPPIMRIILKRRTKGRLILMPAPPMDQALEKKQTIVMTRVQNKIQISKPYQKVLSRNSELQYTQYDILRFKPVILNLTKSKQFSQFTLGRWQLFWIYSTHGELLHEIVFELFIKGLIDSCHVDTEIVKSYTIPANPSTTKLYGEFCVYYSQLCLYVYRALKEQLNDVESSTKVELSGGEAVELKIVIGNVEADS